VSAILVELCYSSQTVCGQTNTLKLRYVVLLQCRPEIALKTRGLC